MNPKCFHVFLPSQCYLMRFSNFQPISCLFLASSKTVRPFKRDFSARTPLTLGVYSVFFHTAHNKQHKPHIIYPNNETLTIGAFIARLLLYIIALKRASTGMVFCVCWKGISTSTIISILRSFQALFRLRQIELDNWLCGMFHWNSIKLKLKWNLISG